MPVISCIMSAYLTIVDLILNYISFQSNIILNIVCYFILCYVILYFVTHKLILLHIMCYVMLCYV